VQVELVEAAKRGDHGAFEALVLGTADRLYGVAALVLRDSSRAEDAVQETLVLAWRHLPQLRDPERFDAWLNRLLVNACRDLGRDDRRFNAEVQVIHAEPLAVDASSVIGDRDQLQRGFRRLKQEQRVVLVLHYYLGLSVPEIADSLGVPAGTAKSRLHYAAAAMRAALDADARGRGTATTGRTA
jgi:RNA polymerase sigma-70 factor (ECF subfamily)